MRFLSVVGYSVALACFALVPAAHAQLLGTTVTGQLFFSGSTMNFLTPSSATISDPGVEFTYGRISVDFTNTDLLITEAGLAPAGSLNPQQFIFTDAAFAGLTVSSGSGTFPSPGLSPSLVGTTLTLTSPGTTTPVNTTVITASYHFTAVTPEPGCVALLVGVTMTGGGCLVRRRLRVKKAA